MQCCQEEGPYVVLTHVWAGAGRGWKGERAIDARQWEESHVWTHGLTAMAWEYLGGFGQEGGTVSSVLWEDLSGRCAEETSRRRGNQGAGDKTRWGQKSGALTK